MSAPDDRPPAAQRVLFMARTGSVRGLQDILRDRAQTAVFSPDRAKDPTLEGYRRFGWSELWRLRRELRAGAYDLVVCHAPAEGLARPHGFFFKRGLTTAKKWLLNFASLGPGLVPWLLRGTGVPLVVYEWDDTTVIQRKHWGLLEACTAYFKINCPPNTYKAFLFQGARNGDVFNIVRQPQLKAWAGKIRPISLGTPDTELLRSCRGTAKTADVFFAGALKYTRVREEGLPLLRRLEAEGFRVDLPEDRLEPAEFYRRLAGAWLAWAPEGADWDTHRAYEAAMVGTVPLLNYPTIRRFQPLENGVHAFHYGVEGDGLLQVARHALENKDRLAEMARAAQAHVERYHTHAKLADQLLAAGRRLG
ncbi:MAG: glycosyltransferase [Verrucomicrobiota bacterium]